MVSRNGDYFDDPKDDDSQVFLLVIGVVTWVFVVVWFCINALSTKIKLGSVAYIVVSVLLLEL